MAFQCLGYGGGKAVPVHRQRAACRQLVGVRGPHHQRTGPPHFFMQQPHGVVLPVVGAEGVGADQLCQTVGLVRVCAFYRPHFMQHDRQPGLGRAPGSFRAGEAAADNVKGLTWVQFSRFAAP